mgnify:CR=1 FL=1|jgi:hypothetical protein
MYDIQCVSCISLYDIYRHRIDVDETWITISNKIEDRLICCRVTFDGGPHKLRSTETILCTNLTIANNVPMHTSVAFLA